MPLTVDRWINASCLQKAIRRNHAQHALMAAGHLLTIAPEYLVRRLAVIAVEDIGIANLPLVSGYLAEVAVLMKNPAGALPWVERLCASAKSRLLCDLSFVGTTHPDSKKLAFELGWLPPALLWKRLESETDLLTKFVALLQLPHKEVMAWVEGMEGGIGLADTIRRARRWGAEGMEIGLPLVWREQPSHEVKTNLPQPEMLGGYPAYTFDQHTRLGQRAYRAFLHHLPEIDLSPRQKLRVVGEIVFALESGLLDREAVFPAHEALKPKVWEAFTPKGYGPEDMAVWVKLVQERLPLLAEHRRQVVFTSHNPSLSGLKS